MSARLPRINIVISDSQGLDSQGELNSLALGLGVHYAWLFVILFGRPSLFHFPQFAHLNDTTPFLPPVSTFSLEFLLFFSLALIVIGLAHQHIVGFLTSRYATLATPCVISACMLVAVALSFFNVESFILLTLIAAVVSIGSALLTVFWGGSYGRQDTSTIVLNTFSSLVVALIIYTCLIYAAPRPYAPILAAILPLLQLPVMAGYFPVARLPKSEIPIFNPLPVKILPFAARFGIPVLLIGAAVSMLRCVCMSYLTHGLRAEVAILVIAACILVFLILAGLLLIGMHQYWDQTFRFFIPIITLAMFFAPFHLLDEWSAAIIFPLVGFISIEALMWIFFSQMCQTFRLFAPFIFGVGHGSLLLGTMLGSIPLASSEMLSSITPFGELGVAALYIFSFLIAYLTVPRVRTIKAMINPHTAPRKTALDIINEENEAIRLMLEQEYGGDRDDERNVLPYELRDESDGAVVEPLRGRCTGEAVQYAAAPYPAGGAVMPRPAGGVVAPHLAGDAAPCPASGSAAAVAFAGETPGASGAIGVAMGTALATGGASVTAAETGSRGTLSASASAYPAAAASAAAVGVAGVAEGASVAEGAAAANVAGIASEREGAGTASTVAKEAPAAAAAENAPAEASGLQAAETAAVVEETKPEAEHKAPSNSKFRAKCESIANEYVLSRRQIEVLFLLAKGHNAAYIQKKLCITQSTAKTHIYHIYQKLGIHTQQELLAMINGDEDE